MALLAVENVSKTYDKGNAAVRALEAVSFTADRSEMIAVIGPSGCGKSTLLNIIGQVLAATNGRVLIDGQPVNDVSDARAAHWRNSGFGYLYQNYALLENEKAWRNVEAPLLYAAPRLTGCQRRERAHQALTMVGVGQLADRIVSHLSGGQRQRVALARALVNQAPIILADEPTGALDTATGEQVVQQLRGVAAQDRLVIIATHNLDLAMTCNRVIALRDGRVVDLNAVLPRRAKRYSE